MTSPLGGACLWVGAPSHQIQPPPPGGGDLVTCAWHSAKSLRLSPEKAIFKAITNSQACTPGHLETPLLPGVGQIWPSQNPKRRTPPWLGSCLRFCLSLKLFLRVFGISSSFQEDYHCPRWHFSHKLFDPPHFKTLVYVGWPGPTSFGRGQYQLLPFFLSQGLKYFEDMKHKIPSAEVKIFEEKGQCFAC